MKKLFLLFLASFVLVGLAACSFDQDTAEEADSYVLMEINPSIEFILNPVDKVVSYSLLNEDAEVLYATLDIDFIDMDIEDAVEAWIDAAIDEGYLDATREDNVVYVTVVNENADVEEGLRDRVRDRVEHKMIGRSIGGIVQDLDMSMEAFIAEAEDLGVSPGHLRIAYVAAADGEITLEEALEMSIPELMGIIHEAHDMPNHRQHRGERIPDHVRRRMDERGRTDDTDPGDTDDPDDTEEPEVTEDPDATEEPESTNDTTA